jgi:Tfp pilus assembly protein PilN
VAVAACAVVIVVFGAIRSAQTLREARSELEVARREADLYLATVMKAAEIRSLIRDIEHELAGAPGPARLPVSAVIATVVNHMPDGMTFERIDLRRDAGLSMTITGFVGDTDALDRFLDDLALVHALDRPTLHAVRPRTVRGLAAIEFELEIRPDQALGAAVQGEVIDVR